MYLYNADNKSSVEVGILKHFASTPKAAADRVEGMFSHQQNSAINSDLTVSILDELGRSVIGIKPLRLNDLWEDDPIGSGGAGIIDQTGLSAEEYQEICSIFYPFSGVVMPQNVFGALSVADIKGIEGAYKNNSQFQTELTKRVNRYNAIGEELTEPKYLLEIVWLDLTFKLIDWAIDKGFDSLVYANQKEGNGEDCYVTLKVNQVQKTDVRFEFQEKRYLNEMPQFLASMVNNLRHRPRTTVYNALWGLQDPMRYWK
ncbi:hypothetical protein P3488_22200 [Vibrio parahaemolyticus]|nr:hypothetical protein [Vibrio parahaemolyticus]HCG6853517.1 hypothetical protein [Vibrio parahaemolyticus]